MTDKYQELVNGGPLTGLAKATGLPQPPFLHRHEPGGPLLNNDKILVIGEDADADIIVAQLTEWDPQARRGTAADDKIGATILVAIEAKHPTGLQGPVLAAAEHMRKLDKGGRIAIVSRAENAHHNVTPTEIAEGAVADDIEGLIRSLGHEVRGGSTVNGVPITPGVSITAPSAILPLHFFLSDRPTFIDDQLLRVSSDTGEIPVDQDKPLTGKVAAVTGSAHGIGTAIARRLKADGAEIIVIDVPQAGGALSRVANESDGLALQQDVTVSEAGNAIVGTTMTHCGRLNTIIHNAGITRDKVFVNTDDAKWGLVIAINTKSQLKMDEQLLDHEAFEKTPRIATVASASGITDSRDQTNYVTSKTGVIAMVEVYAGEFAKRGGNIDAVAPGPIETDMTAAIPFVDRQAVRRVNSLQQGSQPGDIVQVTTSLVSSRVLGINGHVLRVYGRNIVGA